LGCNDFEYVFVDSIQGVVIGRSLMAVRNFLMRSEGKEQSLAKEWFMKRRRKCEKLFEDATGLDSWDNQES
jgi:hypothetical protein